MAKRKDKKKRNHQISIIDFNKIDKGNLDRITVPVFPNFVHNIADVGVIKITIMKQLTEYFNITEKSSRNILATIPSDKVIRVSGFVSRFKYANFIDAEGHRTRRLHKICLSDVYFSYDIEKENSEFLDSHIWINTEKFEGAYIPNFNEKNINIHLGDYFSFIGSVNKYENESRYGINNWVAVHSKLPYVKDGKVYYVEESLNKHFELAKIDNEKGCLMCYEESDVLKELNQNKHHFKFNK